ncbi:MAG: hypothetical protein AB9922_07440 [Bacteroidales bacterium]
MRNIFYIITLLFMGSCGTFKKVPVTPPITLSHKIVEKLVPVVIPADSSNLNVRFYCDSLNRVRIAEFNEFKSKNVVSEWKFLNETFSYKLDITPPKMYVPSTHEYVEVPAPYPVTVEVNVLTKMQRAQIWLGRLFMLLLGGYLALKVNWATLIKSLLKIIKNL